jgi:hypothetical protein
LLFSLLTSFKGVIIGVKFEYYKKVKSRNFLFFIDEEPNLNLTCEEFPKNRSFLAHFIDHNSNINHTFMIAYHIPKIEYTIDLLHEKIMSNIHRSDDLQFFLENNPHRDDITCEYEKYNHYVKQDMSRLRKLESFLIKYKSYHPRKPVYTGEEKDNVNTY